MSNQKITVQKVESGRSMDDAFSIRQTVFVEEQQVDPALEYDEFEDTSNHFLAFLNGEPVGTARWRKTPNGIKLERFAVLKEYRGEGVGSELVKAVLDDIPSEYEIYLHSQIQVCKMYSKFGFVEEGDQFEEAGIMHYKMVLRST